LIYPRFAAQDGPGVLFKVLSVFSLRDIDVTKIESRPMRSDPLLHACYDAELGTHPFLHHPQLTSLKCTAWTAAPVLDLHGVLIFTAQCHEPQKLYP
jgi:hypothetical protein